MSTKLSLYFAVIYLFKIQSWSSYLASKAQNIDQISVPYIKVKIKCVRDIFFSFSAFNLGLKKANYYGTSLLLSCMFWIHKFETVCSKKKAKHMHNSLSHCAAMAQAARMVQDYIWQWILYHVLKWCLGVYVSMWECAISWPPLIESNYSFLQKS